MTWLRTAGLVVLLLPAGCGLGSSEQDCTVMDVGWDVRVDVARELAGRSETMELQLCVADTCSVLREFKHVRLTQRPSFGSLDDVPEDEATLVVSLTGKDGSELATTSQDVGLSTVYPNGEDCGAAKIVDAGTTVNLGG